MTRAANPAGMLLLLLPLACPAPAAAQAEQPRAVLAGTEHDFGAADRGTVVGHTFTVRNAGTTNLVFERAEVTDPALTLRLRKVLLPGEEGQIRLELATEQVRGFLRASAILATNDPRLPAVTLSLQGWVKWRIDVLPQAAVFLSAYRGEPGARELTIVNNDARPLALRLVRAPAARFSATLDTREEGRRYLLVVQARPEAPAGRHAELLEILTDDPQTPRLQIPVYLFLKNKVYADPDEADFGTLDRARLQRSPELLPYLTQSFQVRHQSNPDFQIHVESDLPWLRLEKTPAGGSSVYRIEARVVADQLAPGPMAGAIRVRTNEKDFPELIIPVRGEVR